MSGTLHHGQRFYRLRHHPHHPTPGRANLAQAYRKKPGVFRLARNRCVGLRQHIHRTSVGPGMGTQRPTAYLHGYHMVGRRSGWCMAQSHKRRKAEAEPHSRHRRFHDWVGHVCASAASPHLNYDPHRLRIHTYGCGCGTYHRDLVRPEGPQCHYDRRLGSEQLSVHDTIPTHCGWVLVHGSHGRADATSP